MSSRGEYGEFMKGIRMWVELYELDDAFYSRLVKGFDYEKVSRVSVYKYLIRFLDLWGVRRTAERIELEQLVDAIRELRGELERLKGVRLTDVNLDDKRIEESIRRIYERISSVKGVGATSASKIMHVLNPNLFVMWDSDIRSDYDMGEGSKDYLNFIRMMQEKAIAFLKYFGEERGCGRDEAERLLSEEHGGKSIAKLIDEYNWLRTRKWRRKLEYLF